MELNLSEPFLLRDKSFGWSFLRSGVKADLLAASSFEKSFVVILSENVNVNEDSFV